VLLVGEVFEERTEIVKGKTVTLLFVELLSVAVMTIGAFRRGWAKTPACSTKSTGVVGVRKACSCVRFVPLFGGRDEVVTVREGVVPGLAVRETWTFWVESGTRETAPGDAWIAKGATAVTAREKVAECVIEPLVPVTVIVLVPIDAPSDADNATEEACPTEAVKIGAILAGYGVTPVGIPESVKLIVLLKPFNAFADIVCPWEIPCCWRLTLGNTRASVKSATGGGGGGPPDDPPPPHEESGAMDWNTTAVKRNR
jgi:hypothetical protein